eukprot:TRINITY_DN2450_c0_g1_i1.p1 TRINITY_DN2450_c0_g1~~TRINITY_DN2450_c0_g1_i1.p1  ORF type:complete len:585 (-),score=97.03 TRINITY_DN2450_c0_g1_i1:28-1782(-)
MQADKETVLLDGNNLTLDTLLELGRGDYKIGLVPSAWERVEKSRRVIEEILVSGKVVYGINTGFGNFANVVVKDDELETLQVNLIRSHAAGTGNNLDQESTRRLFVSRVNVLAKGYSGISRETLQGVIDVFNSGCLPCVPSQGTLGASGDLAPLAHLALGCMGEGEMWNPKTQKIEQAADVLASHGLKPLSLKAKEGLALINGTQFIVAIGAEALMRTQNLITTADYIAGLTLEALRGTVKAFSPEIHNARPHKGQIRSALNMRSCLNSPYFPSEIFHSHANCDKVQDAYSLRCAPQVHGVGHDVVDFVKGILTTELNSATDNPMVFVHGDSGYTISGGNFHGEYPAKALDFLSIACHEIASISERRIERLVNTTLSDLPAFLVAKGGLNSGFMIAHCTTAALVSENKGLCMPASVDTIPTSAEKEDHVSMGGWAARKALEIVKNAEVVLATEMVIACQALDFLRPLKSTMPLEALHARVRQDIAHWEEDRFMKPDIDAATKIVRSGEVVQIVEACMNQVPELRIELSAQQSPSLNRLPLPVLPVVPATKPTHTHNNLPTLSATILLGIGIGALVTYTLLKSNK